VSSHPESIERHTRLTRAVPDELAPTTESLARMLRDLRTAAGFTQEELAARAGLSTRTVSDLERGIHLRARRRTIDSIADVLILEPTARARLHAASRGTPAGKARSDDAELPHELRAPDARSFVGRAGQRRRIAQAWERVQQGATRAVLVHGDAGIGKTSLAAVGATDCSDASQILYGACDEDLVTPLRPFRLVLRQLATGSAAGTLRTIARAEMDIVTALLPELGPRHDSAATASDRVLRPDQPGVFDAVRTLLCAFTIDRPCVVIIDDLQWADPVSVALLRFLLANECGAVLFLVTLRPDDAAPHVAALLAALERSVTLEEMRVVPFAADEVESLVRQRFSSAPPALASALLAEFGGNPFFLGHAIEQLAGPDGRLDRAWRRRLHDGIDTGATVGLALEAQLDRLDPSIRNALSTAATLGNTFTVDDLTALCGVELLPLVDGLEDAVRLGVIVESQDAYGQFVFAHGLVRSTLYRSMTATRRALMHRRIAEHLEISHDDEVLAHHYARAIGVADSAERAVHHARRSAHATRDACAWDETIIWLELAMAAADPEDHGCRSEVLVELGEARNQAMRRHEARPAFLEAAAIALARDDLDLVARAARGYAYMTTVGSPGVGASAVWRQACEALADDDRQHALALCASSTVARLSGHRDAAASSSATAVSLTAGLQGDERGVALATRAAVLWHTPALEERLAIADELAALGDRLDDVDHTIGGLTLAGPCLLAAGRVDEFDRVIDALEVLARREHRRIGLAQATQWRATRWAMSGDLERASNTADDALELSDHAPNFTLGHVAQRLSRDRLRERPTAPATLVPDDGHLPLDTWRVALAAALADAGDLDGAQRTVGRNKLVVPADEPAWTWLVTAVLLAELAVRLKVNDALDGLDALLEPFAGQLVVVASGTSCEGAVDRYLGMIAAARGDHDRAEDHFDRALELETLARAPALVSRTERERRRALGGAAR
jgi:transcriptional regulator with XRE-family HTH domain